MTTQPGPAEPERLDTDRAPEPPAPHDPRAPTAPTGPRAAGERADLESFVRAHGAGLMRLAVLVTGSRADAEDLWQDTFLDVQRHWRRVASSGAPRAYVRAMLVNRHTSNRRRRWTGERPTDPHTLTGVVPDPTTRVDGDDALWALLATLPRQTRAVLVLRYVEDLDDAAIGEVLGLARSSVSSAASRGLKALRAKETRDG